LFEQAKKQKAEVKQQTIGTTLINKRKRKHTNMNRKSIVLAGALGLALLSMASAATTNYVYVTGSTAARGQVYSTLIAGGAVFDGSLGGIFSVTEGGTSAGGSTYMNIGGHLFGGDAGVITIVKCHWSGSEAGIADLVGGTESFLADSAPTDLTGASPGPFVNNQAVDVAMADNDKAYSRNPGLVANGTFVGVIPFKWVRERGSLASIANVTDAQIRVLLSGGAPASLLTGNAADTSWVYITGRDNLSGTRVNSLGIPGYGINTTPFQLELDSTGKMLDNPTGSHIYLSGWGYSGGSSVATQMGVDLGQATSQDLYTGTLNHFSVIAYLGYSDATAAINNGGTELSYNGVMESTQAIQEGRYGFWGNEMIYVKSGVAPQATLVYSLLGAGIPNQANNTTFISPSSMDCSRNGPTSDPVH
jgi:hypothetical protein